MDNQTVTYAPLEMLEKEEATARFPRAMAAPPDRWLHTFYVEDQILYAEGEGPTWAWTEGRWLTANELYAKRVS